MSAKYVCPVCDYAELDEDPRLHNYNICDQCGVEFGNEAEELYPFIREAWIAAGRPFWYARIDESKEPEIDSAPWISEAIAKAMRERKAVQRIADLFEPRLRR